MNNLRSARRQLAAVCIALVAFIVVALSFPASAIAKSIQDYGSNVFFEDCRWCGKSHSSGSAFYMLTGDVGTVEDAQIEHSDNMTVELVPKPEGMFSDYDYGYDLVVEADFTSVGDGMGWFRVTNPSTGEEVCSAFNIPIVNVCDDDEAMLDSLTYNMHPDALPGSLEGVSVDEYVISYQIDPTESSYSISGNMSGPDAWESTYQEHLENYSSTYESLGLGYFPQEDETLYLDNGVEATFSHWGGCPLGDLPDKADFSIVSETKDEETGLTTVVHEALFVGVWETADGSPIFANPRYGEGVKPYSYADGTITFDDDAVGTWYELTIDAPEDVFNRLYSFSVENQCMAFSAADFSKNDPLYREGGLDDGPFYVRAGGDGAEIMSYYSSFSSKLPTYSLEPADAGTISYDTSMHILTVTLTEPATLHIDAGDRRVLEGPNGARLSYIENDGNADKWDGVSFIAEKLEGDAADDASAYILQMIGGNGAAAVFDLSLEKNGQKVQPGELGSSSVQVTLPMPDSIDPGYVVVFTVGDNGSVTNVWSDVDEQARTVTFSASHFSTYVVAGYATSETVTMYRLYNQWTGEHFYTASAEERDGLVAVGWTDEGKGWTAPTSGDPVYRLYNPYVTGGDHHYTPSEAERDTLVAAGWEYEGVGWYSAPAATGTPLYRQYNPYATTGTHNYTTSEDERDHLVSVGWRDEGVAWYGV